MGSLKGDDDSPNRHLSGKRIWLLDIWETLMLIFLWCGAVCISLSGASSIAPQPLNLIQFKNMIQCTNTRSWWNFIDYGCYCGYGGSGKPVDELDRCCQVHDKCYADASRLYGCWPFWTYYTYTCSRRNLVCRGNSTKCKAFVCNCDRVAAKCFAKAPYNKKNYNINTNRCK